MVSRRDILQFAANVALGAIAHAISGTPSLRIHDVSDGTTSLTISARTDAGAIPFDASAFGTVGVFDVDWLTEPRFSRLLDNLAASPGAFAGVRFFGALNSGTREDVVPTDGGTLWLDPTVPPDFTATFDALHALTSRGLLPLVQLSFFPVAVSASPITPPPSWERWQLLVHALLDGLAMDSRFGIEAMRTWRFEVWNEPNIAVFWGGTFGAYLDLYRATSQVIVAAGYPVRLGGPAVACLPASAGEAAGMPLMRQFFAFLHAEPEVRCDFVSYHQKGTWDGSNNGEPDLTALTDTATEIAAMAAAIIPERCHNLLLLNDEADEKVGFANPYQPRIDARNPAWLAASLIAHDTLTTTYREQGIRFAAAADNANLQLVRTPFDGRRSILTRASPTDPTDLLKVPAYGFYELLRFLRGKHGIAQGGVESLYPATDLMHLVTVAETHLAALFTVHPHGTTPARGWMVNYTIRDLPWPRVTIALFGIDDTHANGFTAAGGQLSPPWPDSTTATRIRHAAELALLAPLQRAVPATDGVLTERIALAPDTTALLWITPSTDIQPAAPAWLSVERAGANAVVRWEPSHDAAFFSYTLTRVVNGQPQTPITPTLLRAALWVDTAPPADTFAYAVRTVSASGEASVWTMNRA